MNKLVKILLLQFNNYFNRTVKLFSEIEDYISNSSNCDYLTDKSGNYADVSFNPNDGITTNLVYNWDKEWNPDYLLVIGDNGKIVSRWFVTESSRLLYSQFNLSLRRDVIADKYNDVLNAPCFIEKGNVSEDDPLIFNRENFECNQIKEAEILLRDKAFISWIAIYYNPSGKSRLTGSITRTTLPYVEIGTTLEEWEFYTKYADNGYKLPIQNTKKIAINVDDTDFLHTFEPYAIFDSELNYVRTGETADDPTELQRASKIGNQTIPMAIISCVLRNKNNIKTELTNLGAESENFDSFIAYQDMLIKTSDNKFYRIKIKSPSRGNYTERVNSGSLFNAIVSGFKNGDVFYDGFSGSLNNAIEVFYDYDVYGVSFEGPLSNIAGVTVDYDFSSIDDLKDEPYGLIMLPYKTLDSYGRNIEDVEDDISLEIATQMAVAGVGVNKDIFDIQIVPYCPLKEVIGTPLVNNIQMSFNGLTEGVDYQIIRDSNNKRVSFAIFPKFAKFTELIDARNELTVDLHINKYNRKVDNQCVMYRLCSPNYSGQFEFSASKNYGLDYFNVDCTYKPFQPYIHINPLWRGLYGKDFNDARGLICGGDFSISVMADTFEEYKLQNKNFEIAFDREIEHLDTQFDITRKQALTNLAISTGKGAAGGAIAGTNPLTIGLGAATGLASGMNSLYSSKENYKENRDYAIDMHNYQLSNVKAQPNGLVKVTAYTNNNKVFPFIEKYTCTDEEIEIFREKLKYEGMTVNAIGKIADYIDKLNDEFTFIKGKIIRLDSINEDSHFAYELAQEIEKGLFIKYYDVED